MSSLVAVAKAHLELDAQFKLAGGEEYLNKRFALRDDFCRLPKETLSKIKEVVAGIVERVKESGIPEGAVLNEATHRLEEWRDKFTNDPQLLKPVDDYTVSADDFTNSYVAFC